MSELTRTASGGPLGQGLRQCRPHFIAAGAFSAMLNLLYLAPTIYMMQVYDRAVPTGGLMTLAGLTGVVVFSLGTLAALEWVRSRILVRAGTRLDRILAGPVLSSILSQPSLTAVSRAQAMREFDAFRQILAGPGLLAALDAPWAPIYLAAAYMLHPLLAAAGVASALIMLALARLNETATKQPLQQANEAAAIAYASQDYASSSAGAVRALGMRQALVSKHLVDRQAMTGLQVQASLSAGIYVSLIKGFRLILQSVALGLGAYLAIKGEISAGAIFAASFLLARILAPVEQVVGAWKSIVLARAAYSKISDILIAGVEAHGPRTTLPAPKAELAVEGVGLAGPDQHVPLLRDISFQVQPGEMVGVIGPSGAGKSTMARIIAGAAAADSGFVRFDGAAADDWDPERLARHIGYLPQDFVLFPGSVKDNICRFRTYLGEPADQLDDKVVAAARSIQAHEMILRLPKGYDTLIGLGGAGLSAGQAQRIALARALFDKPHVLVLDEPNAHLDIEGEAALIEALAERRAAGAAIIVVAHRNNILADASKVMLMRSGRIELFGSLADVATQMRQAIGANAKPDQAERRKKA